MELIQNREFLRHTVTQDNALIRAKYSYTYRELKLSRLISSKINPFDPNQGFKVFLRRDEVVAYFSSKKGGQKYGSLYSDFDTLMNGLNSKPIHISHPTKKIVAYWVSDYEYDYHTQTYEINIPEKIRPFQIALKNSNNTSIPLYVYDAISKVYLCRFYEILYSFRNMRGGRVKYKKWEDLRDQIGCNYEWKHFNNRILKPAKKLFPKVTSLSFDYQTIKKPKSKAVAGVDFVVTINKKLPTDNADEKAPALFPKTPNEEVQLIEDIKHTLLGWGIEMVKIEQLINDPFPFITNKTTRSLVVEKYNRLEYLWYKMDYVSRTKKIKKSKAALFFAAIKNNYESAEKAKEGTDAKQKTFELERERDIADIENKRTAIKQQYHGLMLSIIENILVDNDIYRKYIFNLARQEHSDEYDMNLKDEHLYNHSNPNFRNTIVAQTKKDYPDHFDKIDIILRKELDVLTKQEWEVLHQKNA